MDTLDPMASSRHFEYFVDGKLVIVRASNEQHAMAALRRQYGFSAKIEKAQ